MITDIRVWPVSDHQKIIARGDFIVNGAFKINYTLFQSGNGPFVALPGRFGTKLDENRKKKWYSDVYCVDDEVRKQMNQMVLAAYREKTGIGTDQGEAPGPTNQAIQGDNVPF